MATVAIISRLEKGRPSRLCHAVGIAGRSYEVVSGEMTKLAPSADMLGRIALLLEQAQYDQALRACTRSRILAGPGEYRRETARGSWDLAGGPGASRQTARAKIVLRVT